MTHLHVVVEQSERIPVVVLLLQLFPQEKQPLCLFRHFHPKQNNVDNINISRFYSVTLTCGRFLP